MTNPVLLTTDFSLAARAAYPHALRFAEDLKTDIDLVHVVQDDHEVNTEGLVTDESWIQALIDERSRRIETLASDLSTSTVTVRGRVLRGRVSQQLAAASNDARLAVIGSHGHSGFVEFFLGSTTTQFIRHAAAPTLVIPGASDRTPRNILMASDLSGARVEAAAQAVAVLQGLARRVEVYHVLQPMPRSAAFDTAQGLLKLHEEHRNVASVRLAPVVAEFEGAGLEVTLVLDDAPRVAERVCAHAEASGADLIVAASHGMGRFERFWFGSVTESILRRADRPVLVVRPD